MKMSHTIRNARLIACGIALVHWAITLPALADSPLRAGHAIAHDGTTIYFEVHGDSERVLFLGPGTAVPRAAGIDGPAVDWILAAKQAYIDGFADAYSLVFIEYPGEPKMYTLTPATVARDYLAIADAAGVDRFAYYGFSWGCVTGLQLALRTERLDALVCGGFPAMDGPYDDMLTVTQRMTEGPASLYGMPPMDSPENGRQFLTYYEGLRSFDDRAIQGRLTIPRLNWIGDQDLPTLDGKALTHMGRVVIANKDALEAAGWDVEIVPGKNHLDGGAPDVAVPLVRRWLDATLR